MAGEVWNVQYGGMSVNPSNDADVLFYCRAGSCSSFMRRWGRLKPVPAAQPLPFDSYCVSPV